MDDLDTRIVSPMRSPHLFGVIFACLAVLAMGLGRSDADATDALPRPAPIMPHPLSADTAAFDVADERAVASGLVHRFRPLLVPVDGVRRAELVDSYRESRAQGRRHRAIDIHAPRGTPVVAAAEGTVIRLFESVPGGTTLYKLDPDERTLYYYAHLDGYAPEIREGVRVARGDTIGFVGDTGNAQPGDYHLHFSVATTRDPARWWGGRPTNPYPLLRDADDLR